jgi:CMP-N-acetylneuraminic acid synthetase
MKTRTIKALIAVRSGSVRVENKNVRPFCGSNLLELKIRQLMKVSQLDGVVVNSNDPAMLEMARSLGAETVLRQPQYASDTVSMSEVYANMASAMECSDILYANVTNPLVTLESYEKAIADYLNLTIPYDSLASACSVKEFLWLNGEPINYDPAHQPRSQDLPDISKLTFAISILPKSMMIQRKNVVGFTPKLFTMDEIESWDIDTNLDFYVAQNLYQQLRINNRQLGDVI